MGVLQKAVEHIEMHHHNADGWITLAKKDGSKYIQHHYRMNEMREKLKEWLGEDVYFSQNTFHKPQRRIENIRQLRALYVDVDHYLLNFSPDWVIGKMELELFGQKVPEPNLIIHSGRGFVVIWLHEPVPHMALPLWQAIENHFSAQFSLLGGDTKATDAARIFRVAGSTSSKSGDEVTVQYRHNHRYVLRQLQYDYLPELQPQPTIKKRGKPGKVLYNYNASYLHFARVQDLIKLVALRKYDVYGYRETICFLYRYWTCCFLNDETEALRQTLELNSEFKEPLLEREVVRATKSAETAWQAKSNKTADRIAKERGYPGAGYNLSNKKIISWLDITPEEQKHFSTIIDKRTKYDRKNAKREKQRRDAGIMTRDTYLEQAAARRVKARQMREEGMSLRTIAKALEVSAEGVRKMLN